MSIHLFILAGGSGTRLWPLSKSSYPKQFLKFFSPYSLLQEALLRFGRIGSCLPYVLTSCEYENTVREQLSELHLDLPLIMEPERKNTLPALCYALKELNLPDEDHVMILPTDHVFEEITPLVQAVNDYIGNPFKDQLLLFGAIPHYPETGYGYIIKGELKSKGAYEIREFIEKPPLEKARELIASQNALWNTGIFLFQIGHLKRLLIQHAPLFADYLNGKLPFEMLPSVSIDYGLLEKTGEMLAYPLIDKWVDLGAWDRLYQHFPKDEMQNVLMGDIKSVETSNSLIIAEKKKILTHGIDDLLIIDTGELLFVGKKSRSHELKELGLSQADV